MHPARHPRKTAPMAARKRYLNAYVELKRRAAGVREVLLRAIHRAAEADVRRSYRIAASPSYTRGIRDHGKTAANAGLPG
jgi:hypothetical protein